MLARTFTPSIWKAKAGRFPNSKPAWSIEFQDSHCYTEKPCWGRGGFSVLHAENKKYHNPCHTEDIYCLQFLSLAQIPSCFSFSHGSGDWISNCTHARQSCITQSYRPTVFVSSVLTIACRWDDTFFFSKFCSPAFQYQLKTKAVLGGGGTHL